MRFPQLSLEWTLFEIGNMFEKDEGALALSKATIDNMTCPKAEEPDTEEQ